jgi:rhamnosyltransferase
MIHHITNDPSNDVGIYAPKIIYSTQENNRIYHHESAEREEIEWAISSGSFINLSIYQRTHGFDENYYIDRLDYDYCVEIRQKGFKIVRINSAHLYQSLGEVVNSKISQHSPIRHYYMARNRFYFYYKKIKMSSLRRITLLTGLTVKHLLQILKNEELKLLKARMIIKGVCDFYQGKMGKFDGRQ